MILSGRYSPGCKLPSTRDTAQEIGVHHVIVAGAYRRLARMGLIEIRERVGAFVRRWEDFATTVLITNAPLPDGTYFATLASRLIAKLTEVGLRSEVKIVCREAGQLPMLLDWLAEMADNHRLRGVWLGNLSDYQWVRDIHGLLGKYGVPAIHLSPTHTVPLSVHFDMVQAMRSGVRYLHDEGCRRVALLAHSLDVHTTRASTFRDECGLVGLDARIMNMPQSEVTSASIERFGERSIDTLLDSPNPPDGILIGDDCIGRGALSRLVSRGVQVPVELKICTRCKIGDVFPGVFGLPVARLESDVAVLADAAFNLLDRVLAEKGTKEACVRVPITLVAPDSGSARGGVGTLRKEVLS
jgi:DNA-binding LacI/PurR family transcriptional regulator